MNAKEWDNKVETISTSRVLIADDDEATRILLKMSLTQWGYDVVEAKDGEEAWDILQKPNPPQILTLDWLMPRLDGIELCKRIEKNLDFHPYTIFLTRMEGTENMIQGLEAGADEFILKPFDLAELRIRVFAGERIIKYRHELDANKRQLQNYISNMKQLATDYLQKVVPIKDLITLLQEINHGLGEMSAVEHLPEVNVWQGKILNFIDILKNLPVEEKLPLTKPISQTFASVPAEKIVQEEGTIINVKRLQAFFGNDKAGIKDFISTFISLATQQSQEIAGAIGKKDNKNAKYFFHLLGSASGNSGMMQIYDVCGKGELAVNQSNWESASECYESLVRMLKQLKEEESKL